MAEAENAAENNESDAEPGSAEAIAALLDSPCKLAGKEMKAPVTVRKGDRIVFTARICGSPAKFDINLRKGVVSESLASQRVETSDPFPVVLGELEPGKYVLTWGYITPPDANWEALGEMTVGGVVRFRRLKKSTSERPYNFLFVNLEVLP